MREWSEWYTYLVPHLLRCDSGGSLVRGVERIRALLPPSDIRSFIHYIADNSPAAGSSSRKRAAESNRIESNRENRAPCSSSSC